MNDVVWSRGRRSALTGSDDATSSQKSGLATLSPAYRAILKTRWWWAMQDDQEHIKSTGQFRVVEFFVSIGSWFVYREESWLHVGVASPDDCSIRLEAEAPSGDASRAGKDAYCGWRTTKLLIVFLFTMRRWLQVVFIYMLHAMIIIVYP
jgi:hypothetical protein